MSLQYIIDAYNLINHPAFKPISKSAVNIQHALVDFIKLNKLTKSKNNALILVFDGYPPADGSVPCENGLRCMFSHDQEADEIIKQIVESSRSVGNIVVVSDDKEVQLASRFLHAQICSVGEFICGKQDSLRAAKAKLVAEDFKLGFAQMQKINAELKKKWLS